jgi:heat shock protein HslJ
MRKFTVSLLSAAALVLSSCAILPDNRYDGTWLLTSATDAQGMWLDDVVGATLITIDDGHISGQICNTWGGDIAISNSTVVISSVSSTEMWCDKPDGIMERETRFLTDISLVTSIELVDGRLRLSGGPVTLDFVTGD